MIDTDDKMSNDIVDNGADKSSSCADVLPSDDRHAENTAKADDKKSSGFASEVACFSIKVLAIALSLFALISSILIVAMPLSAMRVFNNLGMYESALNCGDTYITRRLENADADKPNSLGVYNKARAVRALSDADMLEALDVSIKLSDDLMRDYVGKDQKSAAHFADRLDKYIRVYMSLYNENATSQKKSKALLDAMDPYYHPFVYDYKHTLMTLDYAARVYSGDPEKLDMMMRDTTGNEFMMSTLDQSHNLLALDVNAATDRQLQITYIDWFVDYIDQLATYLAIRQKALGIKSTLNETVAQEKYTNVLNGKEFSLFVTPQSGFTTIFTQLKTIFPKYAQLAYDFDERGDNESKLHRLYWLQVLTSASDRLWNMGVLLNYSRSAYGQNANKVYDEYGSWTFHYLRMVVDGYDEDGDPIYRSLSGAFDEGLVDYVRSFA